MHCILGIITYDILPTVTTRVYGPPDVTSAFLSLLKSTLVQTFWCRLTKVVLEKRPLNEFLVLYNGALTLLVGRQEGHPTCKTHGGMVDVGTG